MRLLVRKQYFKKIKVKGNEQLKRSNHKNNVEYYIKYYNTEEEAKSKMYSDFKQFLMTKYQGGSSKTLESSARASRHNNRQKKRKLAASVQQSHEEQERRAQIKADNQTAKKMDM